MNHSAIQRECDNESNNPHQFSTLDCRFRMSDKESTNRIQDRSIMLFSLNRNPVLSQAEGSAIENLKLPDYLIRPRQHIRWNRHTDLLRRRQIDHQVELGWLLDG